MSSTIALAGLQVLSLTIVPFISVLADLHLADIISICASSALVVQPLNAFILVLSGLAATRHADDDDGSSGSSSSMVLAVLLTGVADRDGGSSRGCVSRWARTLVLFVLSFAVVWLTTGIQGPVGIVLGLYLGVAGLWLCGMVCYVWGVGVCGTARGRRRPKRRGPGNVLLPLVAEGGYELETAGQASLGGGRR
jgi:hypothetical protein